MKKLVPDPPPIDPSIVSLECRVAHATELLRCATATAFESAERLQGPSRHLALASMHLMTQAQLVLEQILNQWPVSAEQAEKEEGLPVGPSSILT